MTPTRFVNDSSLESVARRLRLLGYDVRPAGGARLEELFALARREGRIVLTLSARRPPGTPAVECLTLPRADEAGAVRAVASAHEPAGPPFSRCPACNTALVTRHPFEAHGEVPARVRRAGLPLTYCTTCGKWYWHGSHVDRVREWLERAIGRPVSPGASDP